MKKVQKNLRLQRRMKFHCVVVYKEGLNHFVVIKVGARTELVSKTTNRRATRIAALICERRELR